MTTPIPATLFADPAPAQRLERAATALTAHGFTVEVLDDAAAARTRIKDLIPEGASVFTGASETLRLSGIEEDINTSGRYEAIRPRVLAMDRATQMDEIRRLLASPDVVVGSVAALTETGSLVVASASGSQLPAYAGGAARAIWIVGAQKVVPDLSTALRRVEDHALPLESAAPRWPTGSPAPSTAYSSSTQNPTPGAARSCCSAKPSDSETPGAPISAGITVRWHVALPGRGDPDVRLLHRGTARWHPGLRPGRDRARHQARPHPRSHFASNRGADRPAGPEPDHGPRRAGAPGQVHDPRPRLKLHGCVRRGPRRCRDPEAGPHLAQCGQLQALSSGCPSDAHEIKAEPG